MAKGQNQSLSRLPPDFDPAVKRVVQDLFDRVNFLMQQREELKRVERPTSAVEARLGKLEVSLQAAQDALTQAQTFVGFGTNTPVGGGTFRFRKNSGTSLGPRAQLNLIEGSGITITAADDPPGNEFDVTIASSGGGGSDLTAPPVSSTFTWRNQGSATVTDSSNIFVASKKVTGWRIFNPTGSGVQVRTLEINVPSAPYIITTATIPIYVSENQFFAGMNFADGGGQLITFGVNFFSNDNLRVDRWNSVTSFNSTSRSRIFVRHPVPLLWLRIRDNNTDRFFEYSPDGDGWLTFFSESRTAFFTPTKIGIQTFADHGDQSMMLSLVHWVQS